MYKTFTKIAVTLMIMVSGSTLAKGKPGSETIYDIADGNENFTTLVSLLEFTGLDAVLDGPGKFTVFAPTNDAFDDLIATLISAIGEDATNDLLTDVDFVTTVLLYHVTDGRRFSNSVFNAKNMKSIETLLEGHYIWTKPSLMIVDESSLTSDAAIDSPFNVNASNGVIHAIDAVLVPGE